MRLVLALLVVAFAAEASAHTPPVAWISAPGGVGDVADESFEVRWLDTDLPAPTATVTFGFYYTAVDPPTYPLGERPATLTGTLIAEGIRERDTANSFRWATSGIPTGTYRLWSFATEDPPHMRPIQFAPLSHGLVTVAHPGDPVPPAIIFTTGANEYVRADQRCTIGYAAFDPDGTGRVMLEASPDGVTFETIAEDLPADPTGSFEWRTAELEEYDWTLRATIMDARGLGYTAYAQYFVVVLHAPGWQPDGGRRDAGRADAGWVDASAVDSDAPDAGSAGAEDASAGDAPDAGPGPGDAGAIAAPEGDGSEGCACSASGVAAPGAELLLLAGLLLRRRVRG